MSESNDELNFDLSPVSIPVTIGGESYELREASEAAAMAFRNVMSAGATVQGKGDDSRMTLGANFAQGQSALLAACLYKDGNPVPIETIRGWPVRVVSPLFRKAMEISGLGDEDEADTAKN